MTTIERNRLAGMSDSYFESMKCERPLIYDFYSKYGKGDILKGFIKARNDLDSLRFDVRCIWYAFKEDKTSKLDNLVECVEDEFSSLYNAKVIIYKWLMSGGGRYEFKIDKKIRVLSKIKETHKDVLERYLNEDS